MKPLTFKRVWIAETVRLREAHHGPLKDQTEILQLLAENKTFTERLLDRAYLLGQREGILELIKNWTVTAKITFALISLIAIFAGIGSAAGTLGNGSKPVNIYLALATILGINTLAFIFWFISSYVGSKENTSGLGRAWLWLTRKITKGPNTALVPQALISLLSQQRALQPVLGAISHTLWLLALIAVLASMAVLLSTRSYTFLWQTTLLSPDTFVWLTQTLGFLPSLLGFKIPSAELILISTGEYTAPEYAHTLWSSWLIGCIIVYGVIPRLIALIATALISKSNLKIKKINTQLPGYAQLRHKLDPISSPGDIDGPKPKYNLGSHKNLNKLNLKPGHTAYILGLELPQNEDWPLTQLPNSVYDLGVIDGRDHRRKALQTLIHQPPKKLLIACDSRQTPDRGSINFIDELVKLAPNTNIVLMFIEKTSENNLSDRTQAWLSSLKQIHINDSKIHLEINTAIRWLTNSNDCL